tara:strand:- start:983 stop:3160 length:2178 start_codon:yes stop_codon:yes gene_type:complete
MYAFNEVKGHLARLLATENLIVENRAVETASFNVETRTLVLPLWEKAEDIVYDLLVSHEVGHALYTPQEEWKRTYPNLPQSYVNITEDARVEKLMKRRYAGLTKTFFNGYKSLHKQDFFELKEDDLSTYTFIDRINLYFKVGNFVTLPFSKEEKPFVEKVRDAETFDDALKVADEIFQYVKEENERKQKMLQDLPTPDKSEEFEGGSTPTESSDDQPNSEDLPDQLEVESKKQDPDAEKSESESKVTKSEKSGGFYGEQEVRTDDIFNKNVSELNNAQDTRSPIYMELPKINIDNVVISNEEIYNTINDYWTEETRRISESNPSLGAKLFSDVDGDFAKFKKSAQKEVSYLVKEFECKKSADAYARATTSRTGVLDTALLHTYKYNEDVFKKVTVLPDGKNHGLIFVVDWSGSMASQLLETLKQMYNLLWFCKKCQIPFDVYAFTNEYKLRTRTMEEVKNKWNVDEVKTNQFNIPEEFSMLNLFTSKVRTAELNEQMKLIFRIASGFSHNFYDVHYSYPYALGLSGTPLNEALVCLDAIIPQFKQQNKIQKVHCIVLTDGEAQCSKINSLVKRPWSDESHMGTRGIGERMILRNRKNGHSYAFPSWWGNHTKCFNRYINDQFPEVNLIGIRVCATRDFASFLRDGCDPNKYEDILNDWRKNRAVSFDAYGYNRQFAIASSALSNDTEFEVKEDATKAQIKRAFTKSLKTKKMNKKILSEFISMVA